MGLLRSNWRYIDVYETPQIRHGLELVIWLPGGGR